RERGLTVVEERFTRDELYIADEVFMTGTAAELTPIRAVDDRTAGTGKPGPVTRDLQTASFYIVLGRAAKHASRPSRLYVRRGGEGRSVRKRLALIVSV